MLSKSGHFGITGGHFGTQSGQIGRPNAAKPQNTRKIRRKHQLAQDLTEYKCKRKARKCNYANYAKCKLRTQRKRLFNYLN